MHPTKKKNNEPINYNASKFKLKIPIGYQGLKNPIFNQNHQTSIQISKSKNLTNKIIQDSELEID